MKIIKNVLSQLELKNVQSVLYQDRWGFGYLSTDSNKPIWNFDKECGKPLAELVASKLPEYQLSDWHINGQTFLLDGAPHKDNYVGCDTAAVFFPDEWHPSWGGYLHIDGYEPIIPEANKVVIFDANITHYAKAPIVPKLRVSIGLKLYDRSRSA